MFPNGFIKITVEALTLGIGYFHLKGGLPLVLFVKAAGHPLHLFLLLRLTGKFWNTIPGDWLKLKWERKHNRMN